MVPLCHILVLSTPAHWLICKKCIKFIGNIRSNQIILRVTSPWHFHKYLRNAFQLNQVSQRENWYQSHLCYKHRKQKSIALCGLVSNHLFIIERDQYIEHTLIFINGLCQIALHQSGCALIGLKSKAFHFTLTSIGILITSIYTFGIKNCVFGGNGHAHSSRIVLVQ